MARSRVLLPRFDPRKVPLVPTAVDWSHALANSLEHCALFARGENVAQPQYQPTYGGSYGTKFVIGPGGPAVLTNTAGGVGNSWISLPGTPGSAGTPFTAALLFRPISYIGSYNIIVDKGTGTSLRECSAFVDATGALDYFDVTAASGGSMAAAGGPYLFVVTYDGSSAYFYQDGSFLSSAAQGSITLLAANPWYFGWNYTGGGSDSNAEYYAFQKWSRTLSADEVAWLAAEQFGMLRPIARRAYFIPASGGTPFTGTAPPGSFAAVGFAASIAAGAILAAPIGILASRGPAATISAGATLVAPTASLSAAGLAATVSAGFTGASGAGAAAVVGSAGSIAAGFAGAAPAAKLAASGPAPAVSAGASLLVPSGEFAVIGYAGTFTTGSGFTGVAPTGAFGFSGPAATISAGAILLAPSGHAAASGAAAAISAGFAGTGGPGGLAVSGPAATVSAGASLLAPSGAFATSGPVASISAGGIFVAPSGAIVASGLAPTVSAGATLLAPSGALAFTGYAASFGVVTAPDYIASATLPPDDWIAALGPDQWIASLPPDDWIAALPGGPGMSISTPPLPPRAPNDTGYVKIPLGGWLAGVNAPSGTPPTITSVVVTSARADLTIGDHQLVGTDLYVQPLGGTPETVARYIMAITLSDGKLYNHSAAQPIQAP